ncbi:RidA family protein [Eubacterium callanderi]|uniref:RidA family protein n=1 Tax=Eubacterium callanderi TaxID=53442 RepID=A0A853JSR3_9FIRM|nr:RidA family protein [Eubacterium callanderi]GFZ22700.1 reactive intermediate/imine deaminase [[Clostridium] methoxybenzovorans]
MKTKVATDKAPAALGPYSQALVVDGTLYASGQLGIDPATGEMPEAFEAQAKQVMLNMGAVLKEAGYDYSDVVKTTIFVDDLANFTVLNDIYGEYFTEKQPARSCVQAARIPKDAKVEIEFIAVK